MFINRNVWVTSLSCLFLVLFFLWKLPQPIPTLKAIDAVVFGPMAGQAFCGLGDREPQDGGPYYKWGTGPNSVVEFQTGKRSHGLLKLQIYSPVVPDQSLTVLINGKEMGSIDIAGKHSSPESAVDVSIPFMFREGRNTIVITYKDWNHRVHSYIKEDTRTFAAIYLQFQVLNTEWSKG